MVNEFGDIGRNISAIGSIADSASAGIDHSLDLDRVDIGGMSIMNDDILAIGTDNVISNRSAGTANKRLYATCYSCQVFLIDFIDTNCGRIESIPLLNFCYHRHPLFVTVSGALGRQENVGYLLGQLDADQPCAQSQYIGVVMLAAVFC